MARISTREKKPTAKLIALEKASRGKKEGPPSTNQKPLAMGRKTLAKLNSRKQGRCKQAYGNGHPLTPQKRAAESTPIKRVSRPRKRSIRAAPVAEDTWHAARMHASGYEVSGQGWPHTPRLVTHWSDSLFLCCFGHTIRRMLSPRW